MTAPISACRICSSADLPVVLDLGRQALTGVFPKQFGTAVLTGELRVVRCGGCGLAQLDRTYPLEEMYAPGYGYRSNLNAGMRKHLFGIAESLWKYIPNPGCAIDIGSNDGTLLSYMPSDCWKIGVDPLADWMKAYYPQLASLVTDFFPSRSLNLMLGDRKANVVTSVAMFYDLERPHLFAQAVGDILAKDGVWLTEQAYAPKLIADGAYDFICHEHVEYYTLQDMQNIAEQSLLRIIDVSFDDTNGGSFAVTFADTGSKYPEFAGLAGLLEEEAHQGSQPAWEKFAAGVDAHAKGIRATLQRFRDDGVLVLGYGASTKGNVLLQRAGITKDLLPAIAEVNASKWGCYTPGEPMIPIISEAEARARKPAVYLVLPWHFREGIIQREAQFMAEGGRLFFPFPRPEVV